MLFFFCWFSWWISEAVFFGSSVRLVNQHGSFSRSWLKKEALLVKLVKKPGGTPANQHPMLTTCIQITTCAGEQLCCCFDQREADQMNLWEAVLGFLCLGNENNFFFFGWVTRSIFGNTLDSSASRCCLCVYVFKYYIFKDNISLATYHMMWLGVRSWLKKKLISCYGICLISKCLLKENIHGESSIKVCS